MKFETEIEFDENTLADMVWEMTPYEAAVVLSEIGERFDIDVSSAVKAIKAMKNDKYVSDFY